MPRIPLSWVDYDEIPLQQLHLLYGNNQDGNRTRERVIELFGGKCAECNFSDVRALDIDHIHGDGCIERTKFNSSQIWGMIISAFELNIPEALEIVRNRYQILCCNHHRIKTIKNRENDDNIMLQASNIGCIDHVRMLKKIIDTVKAERKTK